MEETLPAEIAKIKLKNPTMLAAGILGMTAKSLLRVASAGAGAIVTKSVGLNPRAGYPNPTIVQVKCGLINAIGLPNPGIGIFTEEIEEYKAVEDNVPLIVSVYGFSPEEFAEVASLAVKAGADAVELNVSCPHVEKTGMEIGQDPEMLHEIVRKVKNKIKKPVIVKLTPNVSDITIYAEKAERAGADAITAINTVKAMKIDIKTAKPVLANKFGGLSGPAIKPIAVRCVYEIFEIVKIPVIGCGGISNWKDALEFIMAGASAIQIGTAIAFKDIGIFKNITKGIKLYMEKKGYRSIKEIVGQAHKK